MRWLVGWCGTAAGRARMPGLSGRTLYPVGGHELWGGDDPLWAVGDWRPDEVRVVDAGPGTALAVIGCCGARDDELRAGLVAARGGALRHLTAWPGSYTAVVRTGRRVAVTTDLAGARPVFHTPFAGGTAYATAAITLADLVEAQLDVGHLGALLAAPDAPEALGDGTPYTGVRRVPPGHALILREGGSREIADYEPATPTVVAAPPVDADEAVNGVRDALVEAVRVRLAAPRHVPTTGNGDAGHSDGSPFVPGQDASGDGASAGPRENGHHRNGNGRRSHDGRDPGPVPGMGPGERRTRRGSPAPGLGADLSGGAASATLALLAAGLPGVPGSIAGAPGTAAGQRLLAVTFNDLTATGDSARAAELERARAVADDPRLHHVVVTAEAEALPYAGLYDVFGLPLPDEPGPALVGLNRHRTRLASGSADQLTGYGARQVLDAHPARLADLLLDRRRRHLLRPAAALAVAEGAPRGRSVLVPLALYRAARRLARTPQRDGVATAARRLRGRDFSASATAYGAGDALAAGGEGSGALDASLAALAWCRPGPAARWLTGEALADVSVRLETAAVRASGAVGARPGVVRARDALARQAADFRVLDQVAAAPGQRLHAPFLDNQVVRAARALPEALRVRPGARAAVLRTVLAGAGIAELPAGWGATTHAAHLGAVRLGLRTYVDELSALFDDSYLARAGLVDARVVRGALHSAAQGDTLPLDGLADLVSTELWLQRLMERRGTTWTGSVAPRRRAVSEGVPSRPLAVTAAAPAPGGDGTARSAP
ncbi:asparagine synthase-related protein [Streptomyces sp. JJ38]|uniref:asparagine synthase-related protein n=1 Tax=Streptomyces sp. JJ38 TaxID=2738128 RepID=UPI001C5649F7|nr:asparagine synthase-related protein [Streptomyces sp. JJ38]MBW1599969.1 asparagine synthase [Streptomyces sp. JJ38]